ncbi:50S ribosomal protein L10 [Thermosulfuriphilus ammonigenes]|uniref:Large ribosomal subunit protein uL10 n=1 Tax=Thermosulfuriphilus ammonigenes TaxID=1936021 RepID=A0A6G7PUI0_9BACT|nr:50S ribosomal protein L10 [Thermosulfuriphilus ammonigenes]MBA2848509.1 large subunit ribosomal protein L10 [Thermosulfuriphilus ammonigenes]QIJ71344.1 50S ribosomal protein L10 [Thermosulfuriphilus ammonigenes]
MLKRAEKEKLVADLRERFGTAQAVFVTGIEGLTVAQMSELRKKLREENTHYQVVKNTLLRLASKETPVEPLTNYIEGATAVAIAYEDPVAVAKILTEFAKENKKFAVRGGVLSGKGISAEEVASLATLPTKEVLLAQMLSVLQGPPAKFVRLMSGILQKFLFALEAIKEKKAQAEAA